MLTLRRVTKGGISRISRALHLTLSTAIKGKKRCNACDRPVTGFYRYGGRPFGCPFCRSSTRERFVLYAIQTGRLAIPATTTGVLHVAPSESSLIRIFSKFPNYSPVDLFPDLYPLANTKKFDLMEPAPKQAFDLIYLSHVMEHVPDDIHVLKNLCQALRPKGQAWFLIPMWDDPTMDGTPEMSAAERERLFGQWDHARMYGPDFAERIRSAGYDVEIIKSEEMPAADQELYGFQAKDWIFVARPSQ